MEAPKIITWEAKSCKLKFSLSFSSSFFSVFLLIQVYPSGWFRWHQILVVLIIQALNLGGDTNAQNGV